MKYYIEYYDANDEQILGNTDGIRVVELKTLNGVLNRVKKQIYINSNAIYFKVELNGKIIHKEYIR